MLVPALGDDFSSEGETSSGKHTAIEKKSKAESEIELTHVDTENQSAENDESHAENHGHNPLAPATLFHHVQDATYFEVPRFMDFDRSGETVKSDGTYIADGHINIPQFFEHAPDEASGAGGLFAPPRYQLTKFMVLQAFAGLLIFCGFIWLAGRVKDGGMAKGKLANMLEAVVVFIRDEVAQPAIGSKKDTERYLPFLLTLFCFVLVCNLLGMIPFFGAATGSIAVTGVLALITFAVVLGSGVSRFGVIGYLKNQLPHMDLPLAMAIGLKPMVFAIELFGLGVKHFVLAVRLFANMLAGHLILAVFMAFIQVTADSLLVYAIAPVSVLAAVALSCLELLVAFLQAYIFVFLASLFIGSSLHPH